MHCEDVHPDEIVRNLPLSRRQMIEIARALGRSPKLLILDEATSALTAADVERIYAILDRLRADGLAIVYISHRMREITAFADDCSVFRNGRHVESFAKGSRSGDRDRQADDRPRLQGRVSRQDRRSAGAAAPLLEVENLNWGDRLAGINLARAQGRDRRSRRTRRTRPARAPARAVRRPSRRRRQDQGRRASRTRINSPREAKRRSVGMALIPEDRKTEGLVLPLSVRDNISLAAVDRFARGGFIRTRAEIDSRRRAPSGRFRSRPRGARCPGRDACLAATSRRS